MQYLLQSLPHPWLKASVGFFLFAIAVIAGPNCLAQSTSPGGELIWKNGDRVPGHIVSANSSRLLWHAKNLFRDPLNIDLAFLDQIEFEKSSTPVKTAETYSIQLIDGFSLFGEITKLDDRHLSVSSPRFGDVQVNRDRIATMLNLRNSGSLINGEIDLNQWGSDRGEKKYWSINDQGQLQSLRNNVHLFFKSELPESTLIEVEFQWRKKLDFTFGFGVPRNTRNLDSLPRLESWDDSIVLAYDDDFAIVIESNDKESRRMKLLIHWNQQTGAIVIHDEQGKQLAMVELKKRPRSIEPGIFIENKSGDLIVDTLMIRKSSAGFDATQPSVQSINDATANREIDSFDGAAWTLRPGDNPDAEVSIPAEQFCGAFLVNPSVTRPQGLTRIRFLDGMYQAGEFVAIENGKLILQPTFTSQPVAFELAGISTVRFDTLLPTEAVESFSHNLINDAGEIQGRLEAGSGQADDILRWRVAGADAAVPFSQANARIVLKQAQRASEAAEAWPDTLYLTNRDTIPCRVIGIDSAHVNVDSFTDNKRIDQELVKAIEMNTESISFAVDVDDGQWHFLEQPKKQIKISDGKMSISGEARFGHPLLQASGGFAFDLAWNRGYGLLECHLLTSDSETGEGGKSVHITLFGDRLYVGEPGDSNINGPKHVKIANSKARIQFKMEQDQIIACVNDRQVYKGTVTGSGFLGRGVHFRLNDLYQQGIRCTMSNFQRSAADVGHGFFVDARRKELLLTIPRLKKNLPPKQILCASNTDMLRGELVSLDDQLVVFRANHQDQQFPRAIVHSIVWLHSDHLSSQESDEAVPDPSDNSAAIATNGKQAQQTATSGPILSQTVHQTVQILMQGGQRLTLTLRSWTDDKLFGESPALGACQIPFEQISELRFGSFANEATDVPYADWVARLAPAPKMESGADGNSGSEMLFGSHSPLIGTTPESFKVEMLDGSTFSLQDQQGKVVVLDFWATWCGPCVQALPGICNVISNYSPDQVVFVAVNQEESAQTVEEFLKTRELSFPVALDDGELGRQFAVEAVPLTVIIDRDGKIAFCKVGNSANNDAKLAAAIDHLLIAEPVKTTDRE